MRLFIFLRDPGKRLLISLSIATVVIFLGACLWPVIREPLMTAGEWGIVFVIYLELEAARSAHHADAALADETTQALRDAAIETRRAAEASLLSQLLSEYASVAMQDAMRSLYRWRDDHPGDNFVHQFRILLENRDPQGDQLDEHRRYTYRYFHKVKLFCDAKLINPELLSFALTNEVVVRFLTDVLEPMHRCHNEVRLRSPMVQAQYDKPLFDFFREHLADAVQTEPSTLRLPDRG
jgi:hypothetical protein